MLLDGRKKKKIAVADTAPIPGAPPWRIDPLLPEEEKNPERPLSQTAITQKEASRHELPLQQTLIYAIPS